MTELKGKWERKFYLVAVGNLKCVFMGDFQTSLLKIGPKRVFR